MELWITTRPTVSDPWGTPVNLGPTVNSSKADVTPTISEDGLELYFSSNRPGGYGWGDLWVATRATKNEPWGEPVNLGSTVNSSADDSDPSIAAGGLSLYFVSFRPGGSGLGDIWITTRATTSDSWGEPVNLGTVINTASHDCAPCLSADGLILFFDSKRTGGYGSADLWYSTRKTIDDQWGTPVNLGPIVNSAHLDREPSISADGLWLYFSDWGSDQPPRPGGVGRGDLWQAPIIPIVDLNADGIVDSVDMVIMVDHWGTDNSLCDIGPMPWGDGIVDVEDLIVLAEHLFEVVPLVQ
jgi:Tol biopolymer transport system component